MSLPSAYTPLGDLPEGYEPLRKDDGGKNKNGGQWQCPVQGCEKVYTRKRPLREHLGWKFHDPTKLVDTFLGTFVTMHEGADDDALSGIAVVIPQTPAAQAPQPVEGYENDYTTASLSQLALGHGWEPAAFPSPLKKKRKTQRHIIEKEHRYLSAKELSDEEMRRQLERRRQGWVSDISVSRQSGGLPQAEGSDLLKGEEERVWLGRWVVGREFARLTGAKGKGDGKKEKEGKGKRKAVENVVQQKQEGTPGKGLSTAEEGYENINIKPQANTAVSGHTSGKNDAAEDKSMVPGENVVEEEVADNVSVDFVRSARTKWLSLL